MKLDLSKKKRLKKLLESLATSEEKRELLKLDEGKVIEIIQSFKEDGEETENNYNQLLQAFSKFASASHKHSQSLMETFGSFTEALTKNLERLGGTITTSYEKNKPFNAAGVYKDMILQLSAIDDSIKKKPVPVWNWPQYAGVSVRNKSFSNINPATSDNQVFNTVTSVTATNNTAGTAVQLAALACSMVEVFVPAGNTSSQVAIGGSNVKAASGSEVGLILFSGAGNKFYVTNANLLYFDVGTNGDKISYNVYSVI